MTGSCCAATIAGSCARNPAVIGKIANKARNKALSAAERKRLAKRAAKARWKGVEL
jgi:hypothetical protein